MSVFPELTPTCQGSWSTWKYLKKWWQQASFPPIFHWWVCSLVFAADEGSMQSPCNKFWWLIVKVGCEKTLLSLGHLKIFWIKIHFKIWMWSVETLPTLVLSSYRMEQVTVKCQPGLNSAKFSPEHVQTSWRDTEALGGGESRVKSSSPNSLL